MASSTVSAETPRILPGPMILRTTDAGRSAWPTCTPSASAANAISRRSGELPQLQRHLEKPAAGGFLIPQLQNIGSAQDGRLRDLEVGPAPAGLLIGDDVEPPPEGRDSIGHLPCDAAFPKAAQNGSTLGWINS
ncbi:MAG: hypothetical protein H6Q79_2103 [Deltaproteobacteria bacterium]|nr:hypothetical protein [Deltaproteobacteria bacterium]